jgi:hypothetical protein
VEAVEAVGKPGRYWGLKRLRLSLEEGGGELRLIDPWFGAFFFGSERGPVLEKAHAVQFFCPCCYGEEGEGKHSIYIPFSNPRGVKPVMGVKGDFARWEMGGTGLSDLTLRPSIRNFGKFVSGKAVECWHGFVTDGEIVRVGP